MQNRFLRFAFFFIAFLLAFQLLNGSKNKENTTDDVVLAIKSKITIGKEVEVRITNRTEAPITIENKCPKNPLTVERYENGEWLAKDVTIEEDQCSNSGDILIEPRKTQIVRYGAWNHELFGEAGKYRISLKTILNEKEKAFSGEFEIAPPGVLSKGWHYLFYRPIFNTLVFLISIIPGHSLGWAIILLTLIIKLVLLGPNQKAVRAQKLMQKIQPQLDALKTKYKNDSQKLAQETMAVWKKYKVSPMSSCLPMIIQFPILIALFYVVKDGFDNIDPNLLYDNLKNFDARSINVMFLGLMDLTQKNIIVLPVFVGGLQFLQMHLTFAKNKGATQKNTASPMPMMNQMMKYFMPIMIAVFTASLPAAVGFYWGTSTLFGVIQQIVVNKSKD